MIAEIRAVDPTAGKHLWDLETPAAVKGCLSGLCCMTGFGCLYLWAKMRLVEPQDCPAQEKFIPAMDAFRYLEFRQA